MKTMQERKRRVVKNPRKNKLYYAVSDEDVGGTYISALTVRDAKKIAILDDNVGSYMREYTDLKCHVMRLQDDSLRFTELPEKILSVKDILNEMIQWWSCPGDKCYYDIRFIYIDDKQCKCPVCNLVFDIPFTNS